jgi:hypothetical protein
MSLQVILARTPPGHTVSTSATSYWGFGCSLLWTSADVADTDVKVFWPAAGTFSNFRITLTTAPGVGKSHTVTVIKNGSDTAMIVTVSGTATSGTYSGSITVADGDYLTMKIVPSGTPSVGGSFFTSVDFDSTTAGQSGYGLEGINHNCTPSNGTARMAPFSGINASWTINAGTTVENVIPCAGSITKAFAVTNFDATDPGEVWRFHLYKNGVKQDGTGATVDTGFSIVDGSTSGSASFDLPVVAGDTIYAEVTFPSGNPAGASLGFSVRFTATTAGQCIMAGIDTQNALGAATKYNTPVGTLLGWQSTETDAKVIAGVTPFTVSKFRGKLQGAPGAGKSYAFDVRRDSTSPASTTSFSIADAATTGADATSNATTFEDSDLMTIRSVPTGTPTDRALSWSMIQVGAVAKVGCFVCGAYGTVNSTLTFLANLDGVTRTVSAQNSLYVGGNLALHEQSAAPTAIANVGRIFTEDNGAGKTRLMVQFGSGAAVQIAIEP